jgi:hypothetical protein
MKLGLRLPATARPRARRFLGEIFLTPPYKSRNRFDETFFQRLEWPINAQRVAHTAERRAGNFASCRSCLALRPQRLAVPRHRYSVYLQPARLSAHRSRFFLAARQLDTFLHRADYFHFNPIGAYFSRNASPTILFLGLQCELHDWPNRGHAESSRVALAAHGRSRGAAFPRAFGRADCNVYFAFSRRACRSKS